MQDTEQLIRETVKKLLDEERVNIVIGYEEGSLPLRTSPCFITELGDTDRLIWNVFCANNLATYIPSLYAPDPYSREKKPKFERIAIIAKGCDSRSVVSIIKERQIPRERVFIIGVPCLGVIDAKKIEERLDEAEMLEAASIGEQIFLKGEGFEESISKDEILHDSCKVCRHRKPPVYDVLIGEEVPEVDGKDEFAKIEELEAKSSDERWAYFTKEIGRCIRCYACRNACPLCYCKECLVDQTQPVWFGKTINPSDTMVFHIVRVFHVAGRCVDCGACDRACPMNIDLRALTKKMEKDVRELYHYEAGVNLKEVPPLVTYDENDPQGFIK